MARPAKIPFRYQCSECGVWHEGAPSFSFEAPDYYHSLSIDERKARSALDSDHCVIDHPHVGHSDYFIRCVLDIPICEFDDAFLWGIWCSVSEKNFSHHKALFDKNSD